MLETCINQLDYSEAEKREKSFYIADSRGISICKSDTLCVEDKGAGEKNIPWTLMSYIKYSNVRYPSKAKFYCVGKSKLHLLNRYVNNDYMILHPERDTPEPDHESSAAVESEGFPTESSKCYRTYYYSHHCGMFQHWHGSYYYHYSNCYSVADLEIVVGGSSARAKILKPHPLFTWPRPSLSRSRRFCVSAEVRRRFSIINRAKGKLIAASRDKKACEGGSNKSTLCAT